MRSVFDSLDGISTMSDDFTELVPDLEEMATLTPQMAAVMPAQIQTMKNQKQMMLNQYQAQKMQQDQNIAAMQEDNTAMGEAFDTARKRRHLLPAAGSLRDRRFPARYETHDVARRKSGAVHHLPPGRPADRRRHRAHRPDQGSPRRRDQGHPAGGVDRSTSAAAPRCTRTCSRAPTTTC
jgi:hypothetical protein